MVNRLLRIGSLAEKGNTVAAGAQLRTLRIHVDGCGNAPDGNDWIVDCPSQTTVRSLVDELLASP
jgi:hypothetical protein